MRLLPFDRYDRGLHLFRQLVGIAERPARAVTESFQTALFVPLEDLISGLARDPKLAAQRSHAFAIFQTNHKPHSFVHNRTLLPWHPFPAPFGRKV